ncbi:MAG: hypothetical protein IJC34_00290, partial [Lentisphaeria bacterium]|nr:hypothetical protein [Lentisphaeria bacterium]
MKWRDLWLLPAAFSLCGMEFEAESGKLLQAEKEAYQGASGNVIVRLKGAAQMDVKKVDPANPDLQIPFRTEKDGAW